MTLLFIFSCAASQWLPMDSLIWMPFHELLLWNCRWTFDCCCVWIYGFILIVVNMKNSTDSVTLWRLFDIKMERKLWFWRIFCTHTDTCTHNGRTTAISQTGFTLTSLNHNKRWRILRMGFVWNSNGDSCWFNKSHQKRHRTSTNTLCICRIVDHQNYIVARHEQRRQIFFLYSYHSLSVTSCKQSATM